MRGFKNVFTGSAYPVSSRVCRAGAPPAPSLRVQFGTAFCGGFRRPCFPTTVVAAAPSTGARLRPRVVRAHRTRSARPTTACRRLTTHWSGPVWLPRRAAPGPAPLLSGQARHADSRRGRSIRSLDPMRMSAPVLLAAIFACGCASDPDYQEAKRLSSTTILTAEQIGAIPPDEGFEKSQARFKELSEEPTPEAWKEGAKWRFEIDALDGHSPSFVVFRITNEPEPDTCLGEGWRRLKVVTATGVKPRGPAYLVHGRNLQILISTGVCDAYDDIVGELHSAGFTGGRSFGGIFGSRSTGRVTGRPLSKD